jgi:hypothetical protein
MASAILVWSAALLVAQAGNGPGAAERPFHEFHQQITELLKRESQAKEAVTRGAAIRAMCELHGEIVRDARYATSDVLKEYRGRLWSRLNKTKLEIKQQLARGKGNKEALETLAALEGADALSVAAAGSLAESLAILEQTQGGGALLAYGGAPVPPDFGPDLVALIERTINPSFWDTVGGPGTIVYYRPLMCLVVRATSDVHEQIGGVVGGLRK